MEESKLSLTGAPDTDYLVLHELSDQELGRTCSLNTYTRRLCSSDAFWMNRLIRRYGHLLAPGLDNVENVKYIKNAYIPEGTTWRQYYRWLADLSNKPGEGYIVALLNNRQDLLEVIKYKLGRRWAHRRPVFSKMGELVEPVYLKPEVRRFVKEHFKYRNYPDIGKQLLAAKVGITNFDILLLIFEEYFRINKTPQEYVDLLTDYNLIENMKIPDNKLTERQREQINVDNRITLNQERSTLRAIVNRERILRP